MKLTILLVLSIVINLSGFAQQKSISPYEWQWAKDGIWTTAALAGSAGGLLLIQKKDGISEAELLGQVDDQDKINFLDRWAVANHSERASKISDIPFAISFATPILLLLDDEVNEHTAQVLGIYLESMATTGAAYAITAGLVDRSRPYTYSDDVPMARRTSNNGQRSFYSGHVAATATATFFTAKVYQDFNPGSSGIPYVWAGAAVLPAAVGYFRIKAGQHFLTDVLLGYGLGALAGYYIPELHKRRDDSKIGLTALTGRTRFGDTYQALSLNYTF